MPVQTRSRDPSETETHTSDTKDAMAESKEPTMAELLAEFKKGNAETQTKLTSIETSIAANQKTIADYITQNDQVVNTLQGKVSKLEETVASLETTVNEMSDELETMRTQTIEQKSIMEKLERAGKQMDEDRRRPNIIVEGLKEDKTSNSRQQVTALLAGIGVNVPADSMVTVSRLGPDTNSKSRRPRHILVKFNSPFWKQEIFKNINKAKDIELWAGVHIQDDLPQETLEERRDLRCLAALAREKGHRATVRGGAIVVDDVRFAFSDIQNLPSGITMENAKLVKVEDGWAFQSHHAFPSSMYPCKITHNDHVFHCVEQAYFHDMAEEAGDQRAAEKLRACKNGYRAKAIGEKIKRPAGWNAKRYDVCAKYHEKKYAQNPELKQRLLGLQGKLYEATRDDFFGAGLTLAQKHLLGKEQQKGLNKLGDILDSIKTKLAG